MICYHLDTMGADYSRTNPIYDRYLARWQMALDFWRGGVHVLDPTHPTGVVRFQEQVPESSGERPEGQLEGSRYRWVSAPSRSYLHKHRRETILEYEDRSQRLINLPLFQYAVNTIASGVLTAPISREVPSGFWADWQLDVDRRGTDLMAFLRRAFSMALVFGRMHVVVDRPREQAVDLERQVLSGSRAYCYLVSPIDMIDWAENPDGSLAWAVIREPAPSGRAPGEPHTEPEWRYRIWGMDRYDLMQRLPRDGWTVVESGSHGAGRVPIETLSATRVSEIAEMACESPLSDQLDLNREILNGLSELSEVERLQAFSVLAVPVEDGAAGSIRIGPGDALSYPAGGSSPTYISPDAAHPAGLIDRIERRSNMARQFAMLSRGRAEYSKEERSAASLAIETEDKQSQIEWWRRALFEFEVGLTSLVASIQGVPEPPLPNYAPGEGSRSRQLTVQELVQLATIPALQTARVAQAKLLSPVIRRYLNAESVSEDDISAAIADLLASSMGGDDDLA